jgi:hypothetical protein
MPRPSVLVTPTAVPGKTAWPSAAAYWTGLSWSAPSTIPNSSNLSAVVAWNGRYFAAGRYGQANTSGGQLPVGIWRSTNGTAWTQVSLDAATFLNANVAGLVGTPAGLVAWGNMGDAVCSGQGEGMTCGSAPVMIWTSPNGTDWARVSDMTMFDGATIAIPGIAYGPLGLVAVGEVAYKGPAIWVSQTGATWQRQTLDPAVFKDANFASISATSTGYFVGGSTGGTAAASGGVQLDANPVAAAWWSDGQTWHKAAVNRKNGAGILLADIYVGRAGMLAVGIGTGGVVQPAWTSSDGKTWQPIAGAQVWGSALPSFRGDGAHLIAVGDGVNGRLAIWNSDDGVTWKELPFSGETGTIPGTAVGWLVPDGLMLVAVPSRPGSQIPGADTAVWHVAATS